MKTTSAKKIIEAGTGPFQASWQKSPLSSSDKQSLSHLAKELKSSIDGRLGDIDLPIYDKVQEAVEAETDAILAKKGITMDNPNYGQEFDKVYDQVYDSPKITKMYADANRAVYGFLFTAIQAQKE